MKEWKTVIGEESGFFDFRVKELWEYRDLCMMFIRKNYITRYKQTVLGPLYMLLRPLITSGVFSVVFGAIAGVSTDGVPDFLFFMAGNLIWTLFSGCISENSNTFLGNAYIMGKVYFPRLVIPLANTITRMISVSVQFFIFIIFVLIYWKSGSGIRPNGWVWMTPILMIMIAVMGLGIGLVVSSFTVRYRDAGVMLGFVMNLAMYITPVIYPVSSLEGIWRTVAMINPVAPIIEMVRYAFFGAGIFSVIGILWSCIFSIIVGICGIVLFNKVEKNFIDTI